MATVLLVVTVAWALQAIGFFEEDRWDRAGQNLGIFLGDFFPPDLSVEWLSIVFDALIETLLMAYAGTFLGVVVALPLAVLATRPLTGRWVSGGVRIVMAGLRTIPSLLWALLFIVMVGLGPVAGVLGLAAYTIGYLGKLYYEAFEGVDPEVMEAVRATGANTAQLARHVVIPETANTILSQLLFVFEYNVRASSILGLVGAGGVGVPLFRAFGFFEYDRVAAALLMILLVVLAIDGMSGLLRRRYLLPQNAGRRL